MTFFKSHQKLHIWLLADLVLLAAFWIAREHRDWMNALYPPRSGDLWAACAIGSPSL